MIIKYSGIFLKDLKALPPHIRKSVSKIVQDVEGITCLGEIPNCKKLKGMEKTYRIRMGMYRLVFLLLIMDNVVFFQRILPRGEVYKKHNLPK